MTQLRPVVESRGIVAAKIIQLIPAISLTETTERTVLADLRTEIAPVVPCRGVGGALIVEGASLWEGFTPRLLSGVSVRVGHKVPSTEQAPHPAMTTPDNLLHPHDDMAEREW